MAGRLASKVDFLSTEKLGISSGQITYTVALLSAVSRFPPKRFEDICGAAGFLQHDRFYVTFPGLAFSPLHRVGVSSKLQVDIII